MNNWDNSGSSPGLSYVDLLSSEEQAVNKAERLIIRHIELATGKKHVVVNGEDKYIPLAEAKKLGLL